MKLGDSQSQLLCFNFHISDNSMPIFFLEKLFYTKIYLVLKIIREKKWSRNVLVQVIFLENNSLKIYI